MEQILQADEAARWCGERSSLLSFEHRKEGDMSGKVAGASNRRPQILRHELYEYEIQEEGGWDGGV